MSFTGSPDRLMFAMRQRIATKTLGSNVVPTKGSAIPVQVERAGILRGSRRRIGDHKYHFVR
jgi:hypothetical protein